MDNAYALPSGQIVNLPEHCTDGVERFTLRDGTLVWAVRVEYGDETTALRLAARAPRPRKAA